MESSKAFFSWLNWHWMDHSEPEVGGVFTWKFRSEKGGVFLPFIFIPKHWLGVFKHFFIFTPIWGRFPIWYIFQMGWNHHLDWVGYVWNLCFRFVTWIQHRKKVTFSQNCQVNIYTSTSSKKNHRHPLGGSSHFVSAIMVSKYPNWGWVHLLNGLFMA